MTSQNSALRATSSAPPTRMPPAFVARAVEAVRAGLQKVRIKMVPPFAGLLDLTMGFAVAQTIYAAARLGIADVLADGPLTAEEIAERVDADPSSVHRLLRVLATQQVFRERRDGRFEMTAMSEALRSDAPISIRPLLMMLSHPFYWDHYGRLTDIVRSGRTAVEAEYGVGLFEALEGEPEVAQVFNDAMTCVTSMAIPPVVAAYDFPKYPTIVDVGGGNGQMLTAILDAAPRSQGVLFEQPSLKDRALERFQAAGMADRAMVKTGSFFDEVPGGGDLYVLKHVLHDWHDEGAQAVLRRVRAAMAPSAKLLLIETVLPPLNKVHFGKLLDLDMLVFMGGKERTLEEFTELLSVTGFTITRVVPTVIHLSLIEATVR